MLRYLALTAFLVAAVTARTTSNGKEIADTNQFTDKVDYKLCKIEMSALTNTKAGDELKSLEWFMKTEEKNGTTRRYLQESSGSNHHSTEDTPHDKFYVEKFDVQNGQISLTLEGYLNESDLNKHAEGHDLWFYSGSKISVSCEEENK